MLFDFAELPAPVRYRLLTATVVPRPIAWVVSQTPDGVVNAAPFSFFNVFSDEPPVLCVSIGGREAGRRKDTGANIRGTREFVVNLVPHALMQEMHVTAIDFPPETDELAEAGLATLPSVRVTPPRIADSPVAFECAVHSFVEFGDERTLVVGRVLAMHLRDDAVLDAARGHVDTAKLDLVGRVQGAGGYIRLNGGGVFERARLTLQDWLRRR
jgi:flavin reductase (DIM6/NTAB) family NADH-FMN oxidoreductase RutF